MEYMSTEFAGLQAESDYNNFCSMVGRRQSPVFPEDIAETLWGIPTIFLEQDALEGDAIAYASFENNRIVVESCGYEPRDRFSNAHEVGHFSLHKYLVELGEVYDKHEHFREKQADAYASALLMPKDQLVSFLDSKAGLLDSPEYFIAITQNKFLVSKVAASIRLENLGLIPVENLKRSVWDYERSVDGEREEWGSERW